MMDLIYAIRKIQEDYILYNSGLIRNIKDFLLNLKRNH